MNDAYLLPAMLLLSIPVALATGFLWLPVVFGVVVVADVIVTLLRR